MGIMSETPRENPLCSLSFVDEAANFVTNPQASSGKLFEMEATAGFPEGGTDEVLA